MAQILMEVDNFNDIDIAAGMAGASVAVTGKLLIVSWEDITARLDELAKVKEELEKLKETL